MTGTLQFHLIFDSIWRVDLRFLLSYFYGCSWKSSFPSRICLPRQFERFGGLRTCSAQFPQYLADDCKYLVQQAVLTLDRGTVFLFSLTILDRTTICVDKNAKFSGENGEEVPADGLDPPYGVVFLCLQLPVSKHNQFAAASFTAGLAVM